MVIKQNVPLSELTTMRIGGRTPVVITVTTFEELAGALLQIKESGLAFFVLGWGSNVIAHDEGFSGVIIINKIGGFEMHENSEGTALVTAGAGETLDTVIARVVEKGYSGIECLSSIPGTLGAAPVQNAGAYGQEIADTFVSLEAIDTMDMSLATLYAEDCHFKYRDSIFKHNNHRYVITSVTLKVYRSESQPPFYDSLQTYLDEHNVTDFTPEILRNAVTDIRKDKLPSPVLQPNAGSFFKNPIVEEWLVNDLHSRFPDMPAYAMDNKTYKVPAGWLIEHAGLKDYIEGTLHLHQGNALVIVNSGSSTYKDLDHFRSYIIMTVRDSFRITLEQEPEELV